MIMQGFRLLGAGMALVGFNPSMAANWAGNAPLADADQQIKDASSVTAPNGTVHAANIPYQVIQDDEGITSVLTTDGAIYLDPIDNSFFYTEEGLVGSVDVLVDNESQTINSAVTIGNGDQAQSFTITLTRNPTDPDHAKVTVLSHYDGVSVDFTIDSQGQVVAIDQIRSADTIQEQELVLGSSVCFLFAGPVGLAVCGTIIVVATIATVANATGCPWYCFGLCDGIGTC